MKRTLVISALTLAAAFVAPLSGAQAQTVTVSVDTPEFGIRVGAPRGVYVAPVPVYVPPPPPVYIPAPVYAPAPIYAPAPVYYPPRHVVVVPPPVVYRSPHGYAPHRHRHHYDDWRHHRGREIRDIKYRVKYRYGERFDH